MREAEADECEGWWTPQPVKRNYRRGLNTIFIFKHEQSVNQKGDQKILNQHLITWYMLIVGLIRQRQISSWRLSYRMNRT